MLPGAIKKAIESDGNRHGSANILLELFQPLCAEAYAHAHRHTENFSPSRCGSVLEGTVALTGRRSKAPTNGALSKTIIQRPIMTR